MKRIINAYVAPAVGFLWLYLVSLTLRVKIINEGESQGALKERYILTFWHGRVFYPASYFRFEKKRLACLVSPSGDGEIIAGILKLFGYALVRGSTFQHGRRALLALTRTVRNGSCAAMIVDGSRGPARKAQPGSIYLASLTGTRIVTVSFGAEKKFTINSWDKTVFPLPFSKINFVFGKTFTVPPKISAEELERTRSELEAELNRITDLADRFD